MTLRQSKCCPFGQPAIHHGGEQGVLSTRLAVVLCFLYGWGRRSAIGFGFLLMLLHGLSLLGYSSLTHAEQLPEYRLKVAFLYNFATYTEWPELPDQVLTICIYGDDPFGEYLQHLRQKKANERELSVRHITHLEELSVCQIVFISRSATEQLGKIIDVLNAKPVLTITDIPGSTQQGVMLTMTLKDGKVTFEANLASAKKSGLRLSSQLLRFATEVYQ
ncbi:YfiR family protein [Nitrosomonas sp. JL21]|uniref:YfiR family protein n=1 Tax=Nitrosomonas sp. JL21 TaxID=153949 RepID=UPI001F04FE15|nr:YfiR family protein [Nitrosomonas sp. JL21]